MQPTTFSKVFLYIVWITNTDGVLLFQTTPRALALDTTNLISMKCFWNASDTRKVDAVSIVKHTKETFQNVATLTKPDDARQTTSFTDHDKDIEVTYLKHKNGLTLTVSLVKPSLQDVGIYTCHVTGRDQSGSAVSLSEKLTINRFDFKAGCECTRDQFYVGPETRNGTMYYVSRLLVLNASDADSNCKTIGG
ncbi:neurogenic locus Notch protein, partial [Biomphalaria glabrata]